MRREIERIVVWSNVKPGETVWTGIPGIYRTAPETGKLYNFVEYADAKWNTHIRFAFEEMEI